MNDARYVITLVHGTWARKSTWIQPNSMLAKALRGELRQDTEIFRLIWSGRNSPTARSVATERLKEKTRYAIKGLPQRRITT